MPTRIDLTIGDDIFTGMNETEGLNERASALRYGELLTARVQERWPAADVRVTVARGARAHREIVIEPPDEDSEAVTFWLDALQNDLFNQVGWYVTDTGQIAPDL